MAVEFTLTLKYSFVFYRAPIALMRNRGLQTSPLDAPYQKFRPRCNLIENVVGDASLQTRVNVEQVLELTYAWARFLIQQRIRAYNDPIE